MEWFAPAPTLMTPPPTSVMNALQVGARQVEAAPSPSFRKGEWDAAGGDRQRRRRGNQTIVTQYIIAGTITPTTPTTPIESLSINQAVPGIDYNCTSRHQPFYTRTRLAKNDKVQGTSAAKLWLASVLGSTSEASQPTQIWERTREHVHRWGCNPLTLICCCRDISNNVSPEVKRILSGVQS